MAAAERAQRLRHEGRLLAARQLLLLCAQTECPGFVRNDCARWLSEVDDAMPSIVVHAVDGAGADVDDMRVDVDGTVVTAALDGKPIPMDPGAHTIHYERTGSSPIEERIVAVEGQKNRVLSVRFAALPAAGVPLAGPSPASPPPSPASPAAAEHAGRDAPPSPLLPWSLVALGVAATGTGAVLYGSALADHSNMAESCAPTHSCSSASVASAKTRLYVGGAALAGGAIAAAAGVWLVVARAHDRSGGAVGVRATPGGASLDLRTAF
jgi:hypothetical protein